MKRGSDTVTIADVARVSQVSIRTVSRVLNDSPKVNGETRDVVRNAIEQLGFRPNRRARGLAAGRSFLVGVVQDDPNTHVIAMFQRGIVAPCAEAGYELVLHASSHVDAHLAEDVLSFAQRAGLDGILLLPPLSESVAVADALAAIGVPAVGIAARRIPGYPAMLVSDERAAAAEVARHLAGLGHRRIGLIRGPAGFLSSREREAGFREGLAAAGLSIDEALVRSADYGFIAGHAAALDLLQATARPTAIFALNDNMAAGVMKAAAELGFSVPAELSVVGFDDSEIASMLHPALTTVQRHIEEMGRDAAERLLAIIDGKAAPDLHATPRLVERHSTAPPALGL